MKCPLYYAQLREQRNGSTSDRGECLKEDCAWWDEKGDCCAVLELSKLFNATGNTLGKLHDVLDLRMKYGR